MPKHSLSEWLSATRPWSFPASTMPVLLSLAFYAHAGVPLDPVNALWAIGNIILFHAAGNVWSDYFDHRFGVDSHDTHGVRVLTNGRFSPREFLALSISLFAAGLLAALFLVVRTGAPFLIVTLVGLLAALLYPPLKYRAWGDAVIFVAYTLTPLFAMSWIVTGHFECRALPALLPSGILTVAILHVNNLRDIPTDRRAGIRTFAGVLGERAAMRVYKAEIFLPFLLLLFSALIGELPLSALLALAALLPAAGALRDAKRFHAVGHDALAASDEATAKLQLIFSVLLVAGLFLGRLLSADVFA